MPEFMVQVLRVQRKEGRHLGRDPARRMRDEGSGRHPRVPMLQSLLSFHSEAREL